MKLKQIMSTEVRTIAPGTPVSRAAEIMRMANIGYLPVVVEEDEIVGVVTDRDLVVRAITGDKDPRRVLAREVMTPEPRTMNQNASVCDAVTLMRNNRIRRILVVDDDEMLAGVVTLTDVALRAHEPIQSGTALLSICAQPALVG